MQSNTNESTIINLFVYSLAHFIVDATGSAIIFSLFFSQKINISTLFLLVIIYNVIAFGFQPLLGIVVDRFKCPRFAAFIGCILMAISVICILFSPILAIVIAGFGNALFHIGGGTIALSLGKKKATIPGIFVAPGALGLLVGLLIGKGGYFSVLPFLLIISLICILIYAIKLPEINYNNQYVNPNYFEYALLLLLLTITFRSVIGLVITLPWKTNLYLLILFTFGIFFGKALGGYLGDKFGWKNVSIFSLLISAPLLSFGANYPILAIVGMFLFNMTMPITLVSISNMLPGRPGFAFGLACLALIIGALPAFTPIKFLLTNMYIILIMILISTITLYYGLKYYDLNIKRSERK